MSKWFTLCSQVKNLSRSNRYEFWTVVKQPKHAGRVLGRWCVSVIPSNRRNYARSRFVEKFSFGHDLEAQQALEPLADERFARAASISGDRGRKSLKSSTQKTSELPQGLIIADNSQDEQHFVQSSAAEYPAVIQGARNNMRKFDGCVVLTRVGSFYELYFDQAEEYAPLLNIKLTAKKTSAGLVPMAGFPFYQLDRYLKILVQDLGKHVAVSEEIANEPAQKVKTGGLLFDRQVKRVITPGTLIDESFLRPFEHNYLLAIHQERSPIEIDYRTNEYGSNSPGRVGLSWLDLSSGAFFTQSADMRSLSSAVARIRPREIIVNHTWESSDQNAILETLKQENYSIGYYEPIDHELTAQDWSLVLEEAHSAFQYNDFSLEETKAADLLLQYAQTQLPGFKLRLQAPVRREVGDCMIIDKNSLKSLEVTETMRDGLTKGSLLQAIRRTSTASGARLLSQRLSEQFVKHKDIPGSNNLLGYPSMSLAEINERLDLVDEFLSNELLLENITGLLKQSSDTLRLLQKFSFGRGDADDLLQLCRTVDVAENVGQILRQAWNRKPSVTSHIYDRFRFDEPRAVADRIKHAIDEDGLILRQRTDDANAAEAMSQARGVLDASDEATLPELSDLRKTLATKRFDKASHRDNDRTSADEIWIMRRNATPTLERLHEKLGQLEIEKDQLELSLRQQLNADSLSLKFTPGLGHICHVRGKDIKLSSSTLATVRTVNATKSTRSFYLSEWTRLGMSLEDAKLRIRKEEQIVFQTLRDLVVVNLVVLRKNAAVLDDLDVACSSAILATEHDLKRPKLNHGHDHTIIGGRHMMVELGLAEAGRQFAPNDCILSGAERIWLITGPNMAGKSTFLRQTALISILAQTGMFVPAEYAEIGLVDQMFSRVGSADNLSQDQSTFMVEMLETAYILRNATPRSFVIMDEVGRGTTPEDGIAVGYAVLHQLHQILKCRTLFATHFHDLADMTEDLHRVAAYCTNVVDEPGGSFRYDHRLRRGVNRSSHASKVAFLADMPAEVIEKAGEVLERLRSQKRLSSTEV